MRSLARLALPVLATLITLTTAQLSGMSGTAQAQTARARPPFPQITLPEAKSHGQRAIELLGSRLPEVAAYYRKSPDEFRAMLLADRMLKIDRRGRLFVEEELDRPLPADAPGGGSPGLLDGTLAPLDQTFLLHSRPGAKRTIHLNFKGAVLTNTAWNNGSTITALPFDTDGVPYSFSTGELQRIQAIWQRVAEDYAPFDIDVTTEQPSSDALTRSGSGDEVYGTTALITSRTGVYNCSCGGVAYVGVFDDTSDFYKPALVFYDALGNGSEKYVAEAISHEVGHNGGLRHDGTASVGYYQGHGSGATGWAPIMGVGYYQALVQWSRGEYAGANNVEDDLLVLQQNGMPVRVDDHGSTAASATPLSGASANGVTGLAAQGVIERSSDVDVFSFAAAPGSVSFTLSPAARSANLDALLELRDAAGNLLASANPVDALNATLSTTLASGGTYYLSVQGVGNGDPLLTGYSRYGSLGQYALSGSVPTAAGVAPTAALSATPTRGPVPLVAGFDGSGSTDSDGSIVAHEWVFGDGATAAGPKVTHTYGSAGSFTAELRVTDNTGLTATRSVVITVDPTVTAVSMHVADIAMSLTTNRSNTRANAVVTLLDGSGKPVPGATVTGTWSGVVSGSASAISGSTGTVSVASPQTKKSGTFVFTVTGVTLAGYTYQPALNVESSDSITR